MALYKVALLAAAGMVISFMHGSLTRVIKTKCGTLTMRLYVVLIGLLMAIAAASIIPNS